MNIALLIAGPAVMLAIMAWALDKFMPVPSAKPQSQSYAGRLKVKEDVPHSIPQFTIKPGLVQPLPADIHQVESATEFKPLMEALVAMRLKRSISMETDRFPDAKNHKYEDRDVLELSGQKIIFQKNGPAQVEPRLESSER